MLQLLYAEAEAHGDALVQLQWDVQDIDSARRILEDVRPRILQRHLDFLRQTRIDPYRWRYRVIADGDMQRVGKAALHALDEPQGSGEQDEEEEGE